MTLPRLAVCVVMLLGCSRVAEPKAAADQQQPVTPPAAASAVPATPPAVDIAHYGLALPEAREGEAQPFPDAPNIISSGAQLWVDDEPVGDVQEALDTGKLRRSDRLFDVLVARRTEWQARHLGAPLPGHAVLWFDRSTPLSVFKSVFQTAAFAAYPSFQVAARPRGGSPQQLVYAPFEGRVPGPPKSGAPAPATFALHVDYLSDGRIQLVWKALGKVENVVSVLDDASREQRLASLPQFIDKEWQRSGGHTSAEDGLLDEAVLHLPNDESLATAIRVLDATYAPKRDYQADERILSVPAFRVTFSVN